MNPKSDLTSGPGVQIIELTMENPEDQDELNRRLRKPGETDFEKGNAFDDTATHASQQAEKPRRT